MLKPGRGGRRLSSPDKNPFIRIPMMSSNRLPPPPPEKPGIFCPANLGTGGHAATSGLTTLDDEEFTAEVAYESGEEFSRAGWIAAPIQNLRAIDAGTTGR
ncbi:MAG: hypothetical protein MRJ92_02395 [Nitrospira sp.]|nr:hypothetical protein [Nitrospira sp.]